MLNLVGTPDLARNEIEIEFLEDRQDPASATSYTFSAVDFGEPAADRLIVLSCIYRQAVTITSVTIGGINPGSAIVSVESGIPTGGGNYTYIFAVVVPSGTSGDVVVNMSGTTARMHISAVSIKGLSSTTPTDTDTASDANSLSGLTIPDGGVAVISSYNQNSATATWSNATKSYDAFSEIASSTALITDGDGSTPTIQCSWSSELYPNVAGVAWL